MTPNWLSVGASVQDNTTNSLLAALHVFGAFGSLVRDITESMRSAMAPKRKRPRRVQRKIDARMGFQHYQVAALRRRWVKG